MAAAAMAAAAADSRKVREAMRECASCCSRGEALGGDDATAAAGACAFACAYAVAERRRTDIERWRAKYAPPPVGEWDGTEPRAKAPTPPPPDSGEPACACAPPPSPPGARASAPPDSAMPMAVWERGMRCARGPDALGARLPPPPLPAATAAGADGEVARPPPCEPPLPPSQGMPHAGLNASPPVALAAAAAEGAGGGACAAGAAGARGLTMRRLRWADTADGATAISACSRGTRAPKRLLRLLKQYSSHTQSGARLHTRQARPEHPTSWRMLSPHCSNYLVKSDHHICRRGALARVLRAVCVCSRHTHTHTRVSKGVTALLGRSPTKL